MDWWLIAILIGLALLIPTAYAGIIGAPYAPTRMPVVRKAFKMLGINEEDTLIDLGVGDGSILISAATCGANAYGYELSPIMWAIAYLRCAWHKKARVLFGNFYKKPIEDATVIFAFLMPDKMTGVLEHLKKQSMPKAKYFLAYAFPFKESDIVPISVIREDKCAPLYVYDLAELTKKG